MGCYEEGKGKSLSGEGRRRKIKRGEEDINNTKDILRKLLETTLLSTGPDSWSPDIEREE